MKLFSKRNRDRETTIDLLALEQQLKEVQMMHGDRCLMWVSGKWTVRQLPIYSCISDTLYWGDSLYDAVQILVADGQEGI